MAEIKSSKLDPDSDSNSEMDKRKQIINAEPSATIATTKIQQEDPKELEEGEHLFHS